LNVYFQNCELRNHIDPNELSMSDGIYQHLIERSNKPNCNTKQLKALAEAILAKDVAKPLLCQGHDVATVLGVGLQKAIGDRKVPQTWGSEIEKGLRLAFDHEFFRGTDLFAQLRRWETANPPWLVLRAA
jgi:hypothetical protein